MLFTINFLPISEMGKCLKELEGYLFTVAKTLDRDITL
jgi:hypothetical protein